MASSVRENQQPHFILIPVMAQGHMIPMMDIGRLLAQHGAMVTFVTTTLNVARFKATVDRAVSSGLQIQVLQLHFPCAEVGLPEGCESLDTIAFSSDMLTKFFNAIDMLQQPVEKFLLDQQQQHLFPTCIIGDFNIPWTSEIAHKFCIPKLLFHGFNSFSLLCSHNVSYYNAHQSVESDSEPFVIPGLPHQIEITKAQLPGAFANTPELQHLRARLQEAVLTSDGVVINSFYELEPEYVNEYQRAIGKRTWAIGPVSISNKETLDKVDRGNQASINEDLCLSWLNSRSPKSVIYVCFGSTFRPSPSQLMEIGLGLEASNQSFIWVIRSDDKSAEIEKWLLEGFGERIEDRGLIIRGWAPQMLILSHPSIGGFLTHCGWNSSLEAISAGIPMITWPISAEQFFNEKLIVNILEIGVSVGVKEGFKMELEEGVGELVKMEEVKTAVEMLMDEGEEGERRRWRASELRLKARKAMEECGSSYINMTHLMQDVKEMRANFLSNKEISADEPNLLIE